MDVEAEFLDIILTGHVVSLVIIFNDVAQCEDSYDCIDPQSVGKFTSLSATPIF